MPRKLPILSVLDAAVMLARDVPATEIARQLNVTDRTIRSWAKTEEAQARIAEIQKGAAEATKWLAIADKVRRVNYAQQMRDGIDALIAARSEKHWSGHIVGSETGQVAVKVTEITLPSGVEKTTYEAAFDASLHDQARKWNEAVARELGQIDANLNVKHSGRVDHVISRPDLSALTDEELESLLPLAEKVAAGGVER